MSFKLLFFSFLVLTQPLLLVSKYTEDHNTDRESLVSFKNALKNPTVLSSWNITSHHCTWAGVSCHLGRVVSLILSTRDLRGRLHPSLFSLSSLTILDLSYNLIAGEIPRQISSLESAWNTSLWVVTCYLENCRVNSLGPNSFTGKIPPEVGKLSRLNTLDLSSNGLSGLVPSQLDISNNSFSGPIPPEIGSLKNLSDLYIGINLFSGPLPPQIGDLSKLENFFAPSCSITGPFPGEISNLKALSKLDLSYNPLKCSIPKSIGAMESLSILNLVYSELNGSIPAELGNCKNLKTLMLSFNSLSGVLPEELSMLPMLTFSADKNQLSGPLPHWLGKWNQVESLLLSNNRFSGKIPAGIGNCSALRVISLSSNLLSGEIPREVCQAVDLMEIDLDVKFPDWWYRGCVLEVY
ncbi:hypothetical protein OIU77_007207 [Salix suchowensis]|uniref:Leucine-rich repeat-containing N-terminal plant-type domain-containing protein n=1 Tax=Salix suchowensis TaxID=1278906 RepID=A0ABQ9AFB0_9ROSI|nr:hypothetical protein OIU77_007207 [Salix suchowensis]